MTASGTDELFVSKRRWPLLIVLHPKQDANQLDSVCRRRDIRAWCAELMGVRAQEALQLIDNAGGVFYALTYHVLFAIPLFGMRVLGVRAPWWAKIASAPGFVVTLV